jgi:hypothetical protein
MHAQAPVFKGKRAVFKGNPQARTFAELKIVVQMGKFPRKIAKILV